MSVSDGENANASNFNSAFMSREINTDTVGQLGLLNVDAASGTTITNLQRQLNSLASFSGVAVNLAKDVLPTWASNLIGTITDSLFVRIEAIQVVVEANTIDIASNTSDIADMRTTTGTSDGDTDMGAYTGTVLTDGTTTKANIQELGTQVDTNVTGISDNTSDIADIRTTQGVSDGATNLGTFTGTLLSDNLDVKALFQEVEDVLEPLTNALDLQGNWNANTNTPTLASGVGTSGNFYVVSVAGSTNLDGETDWQPGDWAVFDGTAWFKADNTSPIVSVNSQTGIVVLDADDISDAATTNKFATSGQLDKIDFISITQAVDLDTVESDTATNNAKVTNANHTGEVTGATALTVDPTAITNKDTVSPGSGDFFLYSDTSDSGNLKKANFDDLAGSGATVDGDQNILAVQIFS